MDKFKLGLGLLWSLFLLYYVISLFPPLSRHRRAWECKLKNRPVTPSPTTRLQTVACLLLVSLMTAQVLADAFHRNFAQLSGLSPGEVYVLTMFLCALYFLLGLLAWWQRKRPPPEA